ncbi:transcription factor HES-5-like [Ambystoma mexicanum]|uniref:transcription factor HES-5-like n=1 Tax=Ambystoma mexicanum TaxID=8296 RepID=UPI0037E7A5ED
MAPSVVCVAPTKLTPREKNKIRKPAVEKMRRDRINSSIEQLKRLLEAHFQAQPASAKLEKADILEMAVSYLKEQSRPHSEIVPFQKHASMDFQEGYSRCFQETLHFLSAHNAQVGIHAKLVHYAQATTVEPAPKKIPSASKPVSAPTTNNTPWRPW